MQKTNRPRPRKLTIDSLVVESFQTSARPTRRTPDGGDSIDLTCAVNTQWVCGTGREFCPACNG